LPRAQRTRDPRLVSTTVQRAPVYATSERGHARTALCLAVVAIPAFGAKDRVIIASAASAPKVATRPEAGTPHLGKRKRIDVRSRARAMRAPPQVSRTAHAAPRPPRRAQGARLQNPAKANGVQEDAVFHSVGMTTAT